MNILAIDASGQVASAAILTEDSLIAEYTIDYKKTHSQTLLPMVEEIVRMTNTDLHELDALAVTAGPGSFTGLRIGAATVKGLALALEKPVIPVPTLEAMAYNFYASDDLICPLMDARRDQVYTGLYTFQRGQFQVVSEQKACALSDMIQEVNGLGRNVILLGDGVPVYREQLDTGLTVPYLYAAPHLARQRAGSLGALAIRYFTMGRAVKGDDFFPEYLRLSQAERELAERSSMGVTR